VLQDYNLARDGCAEKAHGDLTVMILQRCGTKIQDEGMDVRRKLMLTSQSCHSKGLDQRPKIEVKQKLANRKRRSRRD